MQYAFEKRIAVHGGNLGKGKRKTRRPIAIKTPMHLILKSDNAKGRLSLLRRENASFIRSFLPKLAKRHMVRVYEFSNVGNHLHLAVLAKHRRLFQNFLRILGAQIAVKVTGAKKGSPTGKFWTQPAFTRIVAGAADFWAVRLYVRAQSGSVMTGWAEGDKTAPCSPKIRSGGG
jgi:REP element-mobilizing transposase RayT